MRKLQLMLASLAALPLAANALGLGSIRVNSALNEPLQAQIELLSASPEDIRSLAVQLASHEAFTRAGIDRASSLMLLDFKVEEQGGGRYVIDVTSKQPIREPFLNFLLDAEWAQGRMLREYTVLLDPPSLMPGAAAPMLASPAVEAPPVIARSEPARPAAATAPAAAARAADPSAPPGRAAPAGAAGPVESPSAPVAFAPDELFPRIPIGEDAPGALDYGITSKSDTAWSVANKLRPEGVSVHQVLMALLKSNPEAFEGGNINRLKAGQVLRIDDPALLTAMSRREAVQAVAEQNAAWDAFKRRLAAAPARQTVIAGERARTAAPQAAASAELTLLAAKGERPSAGALPTGDAAAGLEAIEDLRGQLSAAVEAAETERQRSRELDTRLQDLEQQLDSMQRLISLKDDELAALQEQLRAINSEPAVSAPAEAASAAIQPQAPVESQAAAEAVAPPESAVPTPPAAAAAQKAESAPTATDGRKAESAPPVQNPAAAAGEPAERIDTGVPPAAWQAAFAGVIAVLGVVAASPLLLAVAATVVILLMLGLLLVVRRRRKLDSQFQESILTAPAAAAAGGAGAAAAAEAGDPSSFLSDFAVSGMGDLQAQDSEVDPLTEADVFMAYGRYTQAEELLEQAIQKEPGRAELKLKMLELFHATRNTDRFAALAGELKAKLGEADPQWQKVLGMGRELLPGHALFGGAAAAGRGMSDEEVLDIGLDTGIFQVDELQPQPGRAPAAAEEEALDLDFGGLQSAVPDAGAAGRGAAAEPAPAGGELDFDLEFDTGGPTASAAPPAEPAASSGGLEFDLDFNLDESSPAAAAPAEPATAKPAQAEVLEFDLGDLDFGGDTGGGDDDSLNLADLTAGGEGGLDFGELSGGEAGLDFGSASGPSFGAGQDDTALGDLDEVGTKLDLARAYIDMGDPDGARSILDEVLEEGDNHQQQEAQDLLKQIA